MTYSELRPITAVCVVEDVTRCPTGYTPIMRTHDMGAVPDLWEGGLFSRRVTRFVCLSKTQGRPEHVLESLLMLQDKEPPPEGHSIIANTSDSNQKVFKKKHICYRLTPFRSDSKSIVDVIILSKMKNPPQDYLHVGDTNGMHFYVRKISALTRLSAPGLNHGILPTGVLYPELHDNLAKISLRDSSACSSPIFKRPGSNEVASAPPYSLSSSHSNSVNSSPVFRHQSSFKGDIITNRYAAASPRKASHKPVHLGTLTRLCGLAGVPFQLREDLKHCKGVNRYLTGSRGGNDGRSSSIRLKSQFDLDHKYAYDFGKEWDAQCS